MPLGTAVFCKVQPFGNIGFIAGTFCLSRNHHCSHTLQLVFRIAWLLTALVVPWSRSCWPQAATYFGASGVLSRCLGLAARLITVPAVTELSPGQVFIGWSFRAPSLAAGDADVKKPREADWQKMFPSPVLPTCGCYVPPVSLFRCPALCLQVSAWVIQCGYKVMYRKRPHQYTGAKDIGVPLTFMSRAAPPQRGSFIFGTQKLAHNLYKACISPRICQKLTVRRCPWMFLSSPMSV